LGGGSIMKKYFLFVIAIVGLVVMASGCISQTGNNSTATKTYSANGISFNYPSSWSLINQTTHGNNTVIALGDSSFMNSTLKGNGVIITKSPKNSNSTVNSSNFKSQISKLNGTKTNQTVDGVTANVTTFTTKISNETVLIKSINFEKNNYNYQIQFVTIATDIKSQEQMFNTIINSFKA
jgi:PsbP-like protein